MPKAQVLKTGRQAHGVPCGEGLQSVAKLIVIFPGKPSGGTVLQPVTVAMICDGLIFDDSRGKFTNMRCKNTFLQSVK